MILMLSTVPSMEQTVLRAAKIKNNIHMYRELSFFCKNHFVICMPHRYVLLFYSLYIYIR